MFQSPGDLLIQILGQIRNGRQLLQYQADPLLTSSIQTFELDERHNQARRDLGIDAVELRQDLDQELVSRPILGMKEHRIGRTEAAH